MAKFNRFNYIYRAIKKKHPTWTHGQIKYCTVYALNKK